MIPVVTLDNSAYWCCIQSEKRELQNRTLGTPQDVGSMSEKQFHILMACCLSVRYEVHQLRTAPSIPYHVDKSVLRMSWSMVSKAADRSIRVSAVTLPLSMLRFMSLSIFKRAVSVE